MEELLYIILLSIITYEIYLFNNLFLCYGSDESEKDQISIICKNANDIKMNISYKMLYYASNIQVCLIKTKKKRFKYYKSFSFLTTMK